MSFHWKLPVSRHLERGLAALLIVAVAVMLAASGTARAAEAPQAVIIIDGSGSMWGPIGAEKAAKIDLVRPAFREAFANAPQSLRLGLMSFGQRRKGDCSDVQVIAPLEDGPVERIAAPVDKLDPRGKGPIALALREAAKQIPAGEAGTILIVHDGPDNCGVDICAIAADIAKTNPKIVVHLVSLGLEKADLARLQCVSKSTNGTITDVRDGLSIPSALKTAVELANLATGAPQALAPEKAAPEKPGLTLTAALSPDGSPVVNPVSWRIFKASGREAPIAEMAAATVTLPLAPGPYVVEARYGLATATEEVEVKAEGGTVKRVSLNAGALRLDGKSQKAGTQLSNPLVTIARVSGDAKADPATVTAETIWVGREPTVDLVVPQGRYRVRVEDGHVSKTTDTTIKAGAAETVEAILGTGRLELSAVTPQGTPLTDVLFTISEDDPDSPQGRREVARSAAAQPTFTLTPGTYYVTTAYGLAEVRTRIAIGSGDTVANAVVVDAGRLNVDVLLDGAPPPQGEPVVVRLYRRSDDGRMTEVARSTAAKPTFIVQPQRYTLEAQLGSDAVRAQFEVEIHSGRETGVALKLESASLEITNGESPSRQWRVKDQRGHIVLHSGPGGARSARVAPGKYALDLEQDGKSSQETFEIKAGERRAIAVP